MGVAFVFMLYISVGSVLALPAAATGALIGRWVSRRSKPLQRPFMIAGAIVPIAAGAYLLFCIVAMAVFSLATGRDFGFGDGFDIPLSNGYHWSAIDEPIAACVYPGSLDAMSSFCGLPNLNPNVFVDVTELQENGDWITGSFDSNSGHFMIPEQQKPDRWFLFNTKTHERINASSQSELARLAIQHGFELNLQPSPDFYSSHRYHWYDAAVVLMLLAPGGVIALRTCKKARRLLQDAERTGPDAIQAAD